MLLQNYALNDFDAILLLSDINSTLLLWNPAHWGRSLKHF